MAEHAKTISPASDALFEAEATPPSSAQDWDKLRASAADLERAAARLASKDLAKDRAQWIEFAQALQAQARQAVLAAEKQDQAALVTANGDIVSTCEDCHAKYRDGGRSMKQ
ncbi:MAG TPA: cytochrome c [Steroidobacteraceae bacterium]|nr:cytochrome c [Steroidobacteraceae bacterium]